MIRAGNIKDCDPEAFSEWIWSDVDDQTKGLGKAFCSQHHLRFTIRNDFSFLEEDQAITKSTGQLKVGNGCDDTNVLSLCETFDEAEAVELIAEIQVGSGFIEEEETWLLGQSPRHEHSLALAP